jgi:hypothetical protein
VHGPDIPGKKEVRAKARTRNNELRFPVALDPFYVELFGINRGALRLFVIARNIAVSFVMA